MSNADRLIGPPLVLRHHRRLTLDAAALRAVVMMGSNAHDIEPGRLVPEIGPLEVTVDITILLARKPE